MSSDSDMTRRTLLGSTMGALAANLAGCTGGRSSDGGTGTDDPGSGSNGGDGDGGGGVSTLSVAHVQGTTAGPIVVGKERGIFEENGLEIDNRSFIQPSDLFQNFQIGEIPFMYGGSPFVAARAYAGELSPRLISFDMRTHLKLIGPKDVTDPLDLEGEAVGRTSAVTYFGWEVAFDRLYDVDFGSFYDANQLAPPAMLPLLQQGEIKAATLFPPWSSRLLADSDDFHVIAELAPLYREATGGLNLHIADGIAVNSFLSENRDQIEAFYSTIREIGSMISERPELLVETGYVDLFELESEAQVDQLVEEIAELYVQSFDEDQYREDIEFMFEEGQSRGYIEEIPDSGIFDLI